MFSHLCPFQLNGHPYVWGYGDNDGFVTILEIGPDGLGPDGSERPPRSYTHWDTGYTSFVSFEWNGKPHIWAYRSTSSDVVVFEIAKDGISLSQVNPGFKWDTRYTNFVSWSLAPDQVYIWAYRASSSDVVILKIDPLGNKGWFDQTFQRPWDTNYTQFGYVGLTQNDPYVFAYRASDSNFCLHTITRDGTGFSNNYFRKLYDAEVAISVNRAEMRQKVFDGWGCSLCWWANIFGGNTMLADIFFSTKRVPTTIPSRLYPLSGASPLYSLPGLGMNIIRYNIGGGGGGQTGELFSPKNRPGYGRYMYGFWPSKDSSMLDWMADRDQRSMMELACQRGVNEVEFFSNSPPWWMCCNKSSAGASFLDSSFNFRINNLEVTRVNEFVTYLVAVVEYARTNWKVNVNYLEPFNESSSTPWLSVLIRH